MAGRINERGEYVRDEAAPGSSSSGGSGGKGCLGCAAFLGVVLCGVIFGPPGFFIALVIAFILFKLFGK